MPNFLVADLGDNDYGHYLLEALIDYTLTVKHVHDHSVDIIKSYLIEHVIFQRITRSLLTNHGAFPPDKESYTRDYLVKHLKVYWSEKFPTYDGVHPMDQDGGSVIHNVWTKETYTF